MERCLERRPLGAPPDMSGEEYWGKLSCLLIECMRTVGVQMSHPDVSQSESADRPSAWTPRVRRLLQDWEERADAAATTHYAAANRLTSRNYQLGIPVVALTTVVGTSVFASIAEDVNTRLRLVVGTFSVLAAVLASLQTFLRYAERAEEHRVAGDNWSAIRREINEMLALQATRGDAKTDLDDVRKRMDEVSKESPEMPTYPWARNLKKEREEELKREREQQQAIGSTADTHEAPQ
jgi:hypothetical protein